MPFLHPAIAWSALGLASIPIIIHLLNRRRLRRFDWAAMEFLLAALKRTRRRIRVEQLLLLLLRIAMMVILALFIARPMLSDNNSGWLASALKREEKIFVIDDSLSMGRRHTDGTIFDRGATSVATELNRLGRRRAGDIVSLVRTSRSDAPPSGIFINQDSAALLEQTVKSFSATGTRMDLAATLEAIADQSSSASTSGPQNPRSISIVTDLRAVDWTDGAGGPSASLDRALLRLTSGDENPAHIVIFDVGTDDTSNVAISEVELEGGRPTVGQQTTVRVKVRNFGRDPVRNLRLQMTFGPVNAEKEAGSESTGTALAPNIGLLPGGATFVASVPCTFRSPGQYWARVEISGNEDPLPTDNRASFTVNVVDATEVLLVSGEPSSEPWEAETDFLVAALDPGGDAGDGVLPVVVTEDNPPDEPLDRFAAVYLANVYGLEEGFRRRLGRFVRRGGSLVIFLGDQVKKEEYHRQFGTQKGAADETHPWRGLLPAKLESIVDSELTNVGLTPSYEHEFFRRLRGGGEAYFEHVSFRKYWKTTPDDTAQVIATYDDETPAIVEHTVDAGRVVLFTTSADDEWHDWPTNETFLFFIHEMLVTIARNQGGAEQRLAGQPVEIPLDVSEHKLQARYRAPDYPRTPEGTLRATPRPATEGEASSDFRFLLEKKETLEAGLFRLAFSPRGGGDDQWRAVAIRSDPAESDLTRVDAAKLEELYPDVDLRVIRDAAGFSEAGRGQFEVADILLALFVLFLFVEGLLACWFAHHKRSHGGQLAAAKTAPVMTERNS